MGRASRVSATTSPHRGSPVRPDDSRFVYAVKPAIWLGAVAGMLALFGSALLPIDMTSDARFVAMLAAFAGVSIAVSGFRILRRQRDHSAYRSLRPRAWRTDDNWRFWIAPALVVL